jgi:hypothetical protein
MVPTCRKADIWVCRVSTLGDTFLHHVGDMSNRHVADISPDISCLSFGGSGRHANIRHLPTKNLINYPDDCGTPTADIITVKLLLNSIVSTVNVKFMMIDLKDFYLMMPKLDLFPQDIIDKYNLRDIINSDGNVFCEV